MKNQEIEQYIDDNCIEFYDNKLKVEILEEKEVSTEVEGLISIDKIINDKNFKLANNYKLLNYLNVSTGNDNDIIKKRIFMMIQCECMEKDMSEVKFGDNFYVACIGNKKVTDNDKKFVFTGKQYVVHKIREFYQSFNYNDKLTDFFSTVAWKDIEIRCIKKNINECDIEYEKLRVINNFDRDILMNFDNDDEYATKKELAKMKSLCFMMRNR